MKKTISLFFSLAIALVLSSCSQYSDTTGHEAGANSSGEVNLKWSSIGGAYKQENLGYYNNSQNIVIHGSDIYDLAVSMDERVTFFIRKNATELIYTQDEASFFIADASDEGIWFVENASNETLDYKSRLTLISFNGDILRVINLDGILNSREGVHAIKCALGYLYLKTDERIIILSSLGENMVSHTIEDDNGYLVSGADENVYLFIYKINEVEVLRVEMDSVKPLFHLPDNNVDFFRGNEEFNFIIANNEGLFGLQTDGSITAILIWKDCGIVPMGLNAVYGLPENEFIYWDGGGVNLLSPADPSEMVIKGELILATIGVDSIGTVAKFNRQNKEYNIVIKDYSDNGIYDTNTAINRLNIDITAGNSPDMILFYNLSPLAYVSSGSLLDLFKFIDNDSEIEREDIAILAQTAVGDGLYYLSNVFNISTVVGLHSDFGDVNGWTIDRYLEIERDKSSSVDMMNNITKAQFLRAISSRYQQTAVNWELGTCDFDNAVFISILEASNRVNENPELKNYSEVNLTPGPAKVAQGTLVASSCWVSSVVTMAYAEDVANCKLSFIGWPTVDGSCGSDISLFMPIGIVNRTKYPDGCWEFLRFFLKDYTLGTSIVLPTYTPYLEGSIELAKTDKKFLGVKITDEDAQRFWKLLSEIKSTTIYDEVILNIIDEEASAYFAGDRTAERTAQNIQSRIKIYVAEHS